jgi:hypothetical protein
VLTGLTDILIDRTVVLKTLVAGFRLARTAKAVSSRSAKSSAASPMPNIISIYDLGTNDDGSA